MARLIALAGLENAVDANPARSFLDKLAYTAGFVRGWLGLLASPWTPRASRRRLSISSVGGALAHQARGLASLRRGLFGYSKTRVAKVLGPPRAVAVGALSAAPPEAPGFWKADTWYYPFDPGRRSAVAVQFLRGRVKCVEFIGAIAEP